MIILLVIVGISVLILAHELGHFLAAKYFGLWVEEFGFGFPPRLFAKKIGETVYSFNLLPFGGFVKIYGENKEATKDGQESRSFAFQPAWKKAIVILAGIFMNFLLGWLIVSVIFMIGAPKAMVITAVIDQSPAALARIQAGDLLTDFKTSDEFVNFIQENKGKEISLGVTRDGRELSIILTPRLAPPEGEGALGVTFTETGVEKQAILTSFWEGLKTSLAIVASIFTALYQLLGSLLTQGRLLEGFVGPVGIFGVANQAAGLGMSYLLQLIGLISLNLFVLNALPFPALDGGRLFFIIIEKIKGSPLSSGFERSANAFGFLFLLLIMIVVTIRDITRLF